MRLLFRSDNGEYRLTKDFVGDDLIPPYAILSHTWLADAEEPTFKDLTNGTGGDKLGYEKIRFCGKQAGQDGLRYFWVDTCCINKANHNELSQAINSMFRWYRNACRCYVYLLDVPLAPFDNCHTLNLQSWDSDFWKSRWFTRGWTLQELLAPASVEFFSKEGERLGDKNSLEQQIQEITGIPALALQGAPLSQLGVDKPFLWMDRRQTKLDEDKVYSLLGIFDVIIPLSYNEGWTNAFKRLREVIDKREKCAQDLYLTDPRLDKERIVATKGGLLEDSYRWILGNYKFQRWRSTQQSTLLWIKGDPGKGKTMLLCGIINELDKPTDKTTLLSYFFCQATDSRINNATAVLRGLIYMLVGQQPSLISYILKKHDHAGKSLFDDANAWVALVEIFTDMLQDPNLNRAYLIIDALDECVADLPKLLDFIVQKSSISPRVKWIVSSRNDTNIERRLQLGDSRTRLSLELKENAKHVSRAVNVYMHSRIFDSNIHKGWVGTDATAMSSYDQNLDQSAMLPSTEDKETPAERFQEDEPLRVPRLNIYGTQSGVTRRSAVKVQRTPKFSDQSIQSDRDLEHSLDTSRGVHVGSVPCPHSGCATSPTILYRSGRFSNEARSEIIEHLRQVHNTSLFSCPVKGCQRQDKDGYFRRHDLLKHLKKEHPLCSSGKILRNKDLDLYGKSEDKLASRREVKVPCPHRNCASRPTILYQHGRFLKEARSEITEHLRQVHNTSLFSCPVKGCQRQDKDGYFRRHDLVKHLKNGHPLYSSDKILRSKDLDLYNESEDELA